MKLVEIKDLFKNTAVYSGKSVEVGGWVRSVRGSKSFGFIVLSDGTYFSPLQVVYHDALPNFAELSKLNVGAALIVRGTLVETPEAKQPFELQAEEVMIEGLLSIQAGENPRVIEEKLKSFLAPSQRDSINTEGGEQ